MRAEFQLDRTAGWGTWKRISFDAGRWEELL